MIRSSSPLRQFSFPYQDFDNMLDNVWSLNIEFREMCIELRFWVCPFFEVLQKISAETRFWPIQANAVMMGIGTLITTSKEFGEYLLLDIFSDFARDIIFVFPIVDKKVSARPNFCLNAMFRFSSHSCISDNAPEFGP